MMNLKYAVDDRVFVSTDIEIRADEGLNAPVSHYKVRRDTDGHEFWAFDFELSDI